jgi:hypothetical protein
MRSLDIDWEKRIALQALPPREEILGRLAMGTPTEAAKEAIAVKLASEEQIYSAATEGFNQLLAGGLNPSPLGFLSNSQLSWDRVLKGPHNQTIFSNLVKGMISSPMTTHWEWNTACQIVEELGGQRVLSPEDASALLAKIRSNKESDAISVLRFVSTFGLEQQAANDIGFRTDILERLRNDSDPCQLLSKVNATLPLTRAEWSELFEAPAPAPGERPFSVAVAGGFKWLSSGEQEQLLKAVPVEFQINWKRDPF